MPFDIPPTEKNPSGSSSSNEENPKYNLHNALEDVISQNDFFNELNQEKENFDFDSNKFNDPPPLVPDSLSNEEKKVIRSKAEKSAAFVVKHLDNGLAWGASEIALADNSDNFHASNTDKDEMITYWTDILEANKGNIPTWLMLLISASLTYGPIYREAFKARAINKELARRAAKAEADLEILKQKEINRNKEQKENKNINDIENNNINNET